MPKSSFTMLAKATLATAGVLLLSCLAPAQTFTVLHNFTGGHDGAYPMAGLTVDRAGNLYGTAQFGGNTGVNCRSYYLGCGTVFELVHKSSGWLFTPIYSFRGGTDGTQPAARVIFGPDGTLYGTTSQGGGYTCGYGGTCGTVFNLMPQVRACKAALCTWNETILHRFTGPPEDGQEPYSADLVFDHSGNLYGTTVNGGPEGWGIVYKLTPSGGSWSESLLHYFNGGPPDCGQPVAGVVFDHLGDLYGTAAYGGSNDYGCVYELRQAGGAWQENVLYNFQGASYGGGPVVGVVFDDVGNLYGAISFNPSLVYELSASGGYWSLNTIWSFSGQQGPMASLVLSGGNIYGTAVEYADGNGSVFELTPGSAGQWSYRSLHDFSGWDGQYPYSNVTFDSQGNIYGTTSQGGLYGYGVVWEITP